MGEKHKMKLLKTHSLLSIVNSYVIDSPQPTNISYLWNFGSLLASCLIIQIITGIFLAMHYSPNIETAFLSIEHIMRDVNFGWLIRYTHMNTASFFFLFVYMHIGRGLYYNSYKKPRGLVWSIGVVIFLLMVITAFLGFLHSPKWFKLSNNNKSINNKNNNKSINNKNNFNTKLLLSNTIINKHLFKVSVTHFSTSTKSLKLEWSTRSLKLECSTRPGSLKIECSTRSKSQMVDCSTRSLRVKCPTRFLRLKCFPRSLSIECEQPDNSFTTFSKVVNFSTVSKVENSTPFSNPALQAGLTSSPEGKESKDVIEFLRINNLEPIFVYENLGDKCIQRKVLNETRHLSGIYLILNKLNLSCYVGSASTGKFNSRFRRHLFNFQGSKIVKSAVRKYKIENFAFIILEIFTEVVNQTNNKQLLDMEDFYIKSLLPDYNIVTEAGNTFGYKHSEISRLKEVENYSAERRLWIGNLNKNKVLFPPAEGRVKLPQGYAPGLNEQYRENLRKAALIRVKPIYSEEGLVNLRKASKPITVYNLNNTVYGVYPSITAGAKSLRCSVKTISRAMSTPKKILKRRWIVKFSTK